MKMKLDLAKFKLKHRDDSIATLIHPDGHEFRVAIKALHPENRKNLDKLELHKEEAKQDLKEISKMAEGGSVSDKQQKEPKKEKTDDYQVGDENSIGSKITKAAQSLLHGYAPGGTVEGDDGKSVSININGVPEAPQNAPQVDQQGNVIKSDAESQQPFTMGKLPLAVNPLAGLPSEEQSNKITEIADQSAEAQEAGQQPPQAQPAEQQSPQQPQVMPQVAADAANMPSTDQAYKDQLAALGQAQQAEQHLANVKATQLASNMDAQQQLMNEYQNHYNQLDQERQAFQQDVKDNQIDPGRYLGSMSDWQRSLTAASLIVGGLGQGLLGGGPNQALDFLNKQIDRDIDAQKAELNKRETLLSANMRQFGNLADATKMTKVMQTDMLNSRLEQAEAKASNPLIKAKYQQLRAQLEMQVAPQMQQLALRNMLQARAGSDKINVDPALLINQLGIPDNAKEAVAKEVERAQNTRQSAQDILKDYDATVASLKAGGGLGRVGALVHEPREMAGLEAKLGTTVGDLEGSVRQAAMENVKGSFVPRKSDTDADLDKRREALVEYLRTKSSAPRFKSYSGVDLNSFASAAHDNLPPAPKEVDAVLKNGKIAVFDANTKKFLRYK